ncbi:hypothetical protein vseg_017595 [Gypsophila vaccaria]
MDDFPAVKSVLRSASGSHGLEHPSATKKHHTIHMNGLDPILNLQNELHVKLQVKGEDSETSSDSPSDEDGSSGLEDENIGNRDMNVKDSVTLASKSLHEHPTSPVSACSEGKKSESQREDDGACSHSLSTPTPRKLVSAMKGSREKEGLPQKKLSVSWASDVYDPPPTSVSHYPKKKSYQQYSKSYKKHGKGKQKGKYARGGGSGQKEKKHYRKSSGRSDRVLDSYADTDRLQHNSKSSLELLDFNDPGIGSPDLNCGSKFLGQASGTMHCVY